MVLRSCGPAALVLAVLALGVAVGGVSNGAPASSGEMKAVASTLRAKKTSMRNFNRALAVVDNGTASVRLVSVRGVGDVRGTCQDGNPATGVEDPDMVITLLPGRTAVNFARQSGLFARGDRPLRPVVGLLQPRVPHAFALPDSDTFDVRLEAAGRAEQIFGVVREDGADSPQGGCLFYGMVLTASD